jgi:hypothetical protein
MEVFGTCAWALFLFSAPPWLACCLLYRVVAWRVLSSVSCIFHALAVSCQLKLYALVGP